MKRLLFALGASAMLAFHASIASATFIGFDDVPGPGYQAISGDRYQSLGVLLGTDGAGLAVDTVFAFLVGSNDAHLADHSIIIEFVLPGSAAAATTTDVAFQVVNAPGATFSVHVYDASNTLLTTFLGDNSNSAFSYSAGPGESIHSVVMTPLSGSLNGIDSLNFGALVAVSEPTPLALFCAVLVAVAVTQVRQRKGSSR